MMADRQSGIVKWFDNRKGYGFIQRDDNGEDVFVHFREIQGDGFKTLQEGQKVEFGLIERDKGYAAEDVAKVEA
jgi:CspA family cold shock protein